ncbi:MAG TPA: hypothetical protein VGB82_11925 [Alphaproteobacteria bacterium]
MRGPVIARALRAWALVALWLLAASEAAGQTLSPGYDDRPALGPEAAKGAVIYTPGLVRDGEAIETTPYAVDDLQAAGWDVFCFQRPRADDVLQGSIAALGEAMGKLRRGGYKRLVLVGQSFGGWISLAAARPESGPLDAIVALAPAAFGRRDEAPTWTENADGLYRLAESVAARRVLVFLFSGDAYDPGGRGERLRAIFERRRLTAAVVDRPHDLAGHNSGLTRAFARRFGPCLRDFIETAETAPLFVCPEPAGARLADFDLPREGPTAPGTDADPALLAMTGRWYGAYETGRDVLLVVTPTARTAAQAVYAFGPVIRGIETPVGFTERRGVFDPATTILRFAEPQADTVIECRLLADDAMMLAIASRSRGERLQTVLHRVE